MSESDDELAAYVRLIPAAVDDLHAIAKADPNVLRRILKKMLLLERSPEAGEPLLGPLMSFRKLTAVDQDWRIVWRVERNDVCGGVEIVISEVWAVGARADSEVYDEMRSRLANCKESPLAQPLSEIVASLTRAAQDAVVRVEPVADPVPPWLRERLFHTVRMSDADISRMTGAEAMNRWDQYQQR